MSRSSSRWGGWGSLWRSSLVLAVATLSPPLPVASQTITGQVIDEATGAPVGEGFVVLLDERGRERARTLTVADGRFTLRAPAPGRYRLRSERIGYVASLSPWFSLDAGQAVTQRLVVAALGVQLAAVVVTGRSTCRTSPDRDSATAAAWDEVRKALAAAAWTADQRLYRYRSVTFRRDWDAERREVMREGADTVVDYVLAPWVSRGAGELAERGWVVAEGDSTAYYGPDAVVLLDSTFLATHCFRLARRSAQVGLAFEPVPRRRVPDVQGVLWLDESTAELRTLEYGYTRVPEDVSDSRIGGTVEFLRLPSGAWIVHRWEIRMPRIGVAVFTPPGGKAERRARLLGFRDGGGAVLEIRALDGTVVYPP